MTESMRTNIHNMIKVCIDNHILYTPFLSHSFFLMSDQYDKVPLRPHHDLDDFTAYDFTTFTTLRLVIDLETGFLHCKSSF
jgi:hypothetical protein